MLIRARAPGKLVALGEYAVLEGAPALVLAIDRYAVATLEPSRDGECHLRTRMAEEGAHSFPLGAPSGVALVDTVIASAPAARAWSGMLDSSAFFAGETKLGLGSSAAGLCAWAGVWAAYVARGSARPDTSLGALVRMHRGVRPRSCGSWGSHRCGYRHGRASADRRGCSATRRGLQSKRHRGRRSRSRVRARYGCARRVQGVGARTRISSDRARFGRARPDSERIVRR